MLDAIRNTLTKIIESAGAMGENSGLLEDLNSWNAALAEYANGISSTIVLPIALVIMTLFFLLEFYNTFMRTTAGGGGSHTFLLYNLILSVVKMFLCLWAVQNSTIILNALFGISAEITSGIAGVVGNGQMSSEIDESSLEQLEGFFPQMGAFLSLQVVQFAINFVAIAVNTLVAARFIELYVYNAFAAIPLATLCYQELRSVGIGFLKNYAAVAIQGSVIYLVIGFYPALAAAIGNEGGDVLNQSWALLGQSLILLVAIVMSGKFARFITNAA